MKKLINSIFVLAVAIFGFTSCEDVPMPYNMTFDENGNKSKTPDLIATGTGTKEDPFNVVAAQNYIAKGGDATKEVYVKGKFVSLKEIETATYGNASYYISDDGKPSNQFLIYRGYFLGGEKFKSNDQLKAGDDLIVCGKLINFNGTKEMEKSNYIYSLNGTTKEKGGSTSGGTSTVAPTGEGTATSPYNVAKAQETIKTATLPTAEVYVSGIISEIKSVETEKYGSAEYYISDDGTTNGQFYVFHGKYLNGKKFTSADQIKKGDKVIVKGKLDNYQGKSPQIAYGALVSINSNGGGTVAPSNVGLNVTFDKNMANFTIVNTQALPAGLDHVWYHDAKNKQMKASAFIKPNNFEAHSRILSPVFSLKGLTTATLTFNNTVNYLKTLAYTDAIKVFASTDATNWKELTINNKAAGTNWTFVDSTCDLKEFAGQDKVYLAFEYNSTSAVAPTWEIKNVIVK